MPTYHGLNDTIEGDSIYCAFKKYTGLRTIDKRSKDRGFCHTIKGNPARAVIVKKWKRIK